MQRFALLGAGFIGGVHAANLAADPEVDFALVYDLDPGRAAAVAERSGARATDDLTEVFEGGAVDAVYIASSTDTHADLLRRAADAGVAALCEKPIHLDFAQAVDAVRYAEERGLVAMVDFNRRFDRDHAQLRRVIADGGIGRVEMVQMTSRGPEVPPLSYVAVSGGQLRDQTVHFFDLARWLTDEDPVTVFACGSALAEPRLREYADVDTSVAVLTLPSGALVQVDSMRRTGYGYDERIEAVGSDGMVESRRNRTGNVSRYVGATVVDDGLSAGWFERMQPTYAVALRHFVAALEAGGPVGSALPTLVDGLKAQAIAEAATRSLTSGRAEPIEYPTV